MHYIVFYSGGTGSWAAAKRIIHEHGKENVTLLFTDTMIEDEDLYRFVDDTVEKFGCEIIKLQDGRTPWQVFRDVKYIGNSRGAPCSIKLKREVAQKYIAKHYNADDITLVFGIDWSEERRMEGIQRVWEGYKCVAPLCDKPYLTKEQIFKKVKEEGVLLPRLYVMGFSHNNCGGFCVKAGQGHFYNLLKMLPERYAHHEEQEQAMFIDFPKTLPFMKRQENNKTIYMSMKDFRERVETGKKVDKWDIGGCACFLE